jgi:hypothetical protein
VSRISKHARTPIEVEATGVLSRNDLARLLYSICLELGFESNPKPLLVTTAELESIYAGATIDLLAWLVVYSKRIGRIAVVSESGGCFYRATQLAMQSGHRVQAFWTHDEARAWLEGAPFLRESMRARACA